MLLSLYLTAPCCSSVQLEVNLYQSLCQKDQHPCHSKTVEISRQLNAEDRLSFLKTPCKSFKICNHNVKPFSRFSINCICREKNQNELNASNALLIREPSWLSNRFNLPARFFSLVSPSLKFACLVGPKSFREKSNE